MLKTDLVTRMPGIRFGHAPETRPELGCVGGGTYHSLRAIPFPETGGITP